MATSDGTARRPKTLILDLFGAYVQKLGGWIAVADLVQLMGLLGVDEQAVRSAVSRMTRRGLLTQAVHGSTRGYATTSAAAELLEEGDRRVFASVEPARLEDGWVLVSFSMPETDRDKRHILRSRLTWLGLGNLSSGLWIGPHRTLPDLLDSVRRLGFEHYVDVVTGTYQGFDPLPDMVARSWDLDALRALYDDFLATNRPLRTRVRRSKKDVDGERAFVEYTLAVHEWRKLPYLDPGLPVELLPPRWPGRDAAELFAELRSTLEPAAFGYAESAILPG